MNIKELQLQKAKKEIIIKSLKSGKEPLVSQVNNFIKNKFKFSPAGLPCFKPLIGKKYDVSDKSEFNNMLNQIHSDLTDLYDADNFINNEILSTCNYYDSEKNRLGGMLNKLQNEIDSVMVTIKHPQAKGNIGETFNNFNNMEFDGDADRNIPYTTAYIDLRTKNASIDTSITKKIQLNNAEIKFNVLTPTSSNEELSSIKYCIGDNMNETWIQKITCDANNQLDYNVGLTLEEESEINTVVFTASSPRKQTITLIILDKEGNRRTFNPITTIEKAEWNFKNTPAASLIFGISKQEADGTDGIVYEYYIGAKNISIYNNSHKESGIIVSSGQEISKPFSKVLLSANETVPASTTINYYVGIDNGENEVAWMLVENNDVTELNLLPIERCNLRDDIDTYSMKALNGSTIGSLEYMPVKNTVDLHVGVDMWSVQKLKNFSASNIKNLFTEPITSFAPMNYIEYSLDPSTAYLYTAFSEFEEPVVLSGKFYKYGNVQHTIYVNGSKINGIDGGKNVEYKLRMAKGQNKVQILVKNDNDSIDKFGFDAYFQDYSKITKAIESAKETDIYELSYALHTDTFDKFCVIGNEIIVNYNAKSYNLDYVAEYRYNSNPALFKNAKLRVMAVLATRSEQVTPRLSSYQVTTL